MEDARHAVLLTTIARAAGSKTAKWADFSMRPKPPPVDASDGKAFVKHVFRSMGGRVKRRSPRID